MISPREESAPPSERNGFGTKAKQEPNSDKFDNLLRQVRIELSGLIGSVGRTVFLEFQRLRLKAVDGFFRGALYLCLLSAGIALSICAVLQLASGVRGGLAVAFSSTWVADLVTGALQVLLVLGVGFGARAAFRADILRDTRMGMKAPAPTSDDPSIQGGPR
jgi:hypothetical protein